MYVMLCDKSSPELRVMFVLMYKNKEKYKVNFFFFLNKKAIKILIQNFIYSKYIVICH